MKRALIASFAAAVSLGACGCGSPSQPDPPKPSGAAKAPLKTPALPEETRLAVAVSQSE